MSVQPRPWRRQQAARDEIDADQNHGEQEQRTQRERSPKAATAVRGAAAAIGSRRLSRGRRWARSGTTSVRTICRTRRNRREILADDKLRKVFGKDKVTMFEMDKHLAQHL